MNMVLANGEAVLIIIVVAVTTFATRLAPFVFFGRKEEPPEIIRYLGQVLPPAVIAILVVYCLRNVSFQGMDNLAELGSFLPPFIAMAVVILLHVWKRNNLLSIGGGTICYMILIQEVFI